MCYTTRCTCTEQHHTLYHTHYKLCCIHWPVVEHRPLPGNPIYLYLYRPYMETCYETFNTSKFMEIGGRAVCFCLVVSVVGRSSTSAVSCDSRIPCMWRSLRGEGREGGRDKFVQWADTNTRMIPKTQDWEERQWTDWHPEGEMPGHTIYLVM